MVLLCRLRVDGVCFGAAGAGQQDHSGRMLSPVPTAGGRAGTGSTTRRRAGQVAGGGPVMGHLAGSAFLGSAEHPLSESQSSLMWVQ